MTAGQIILALGGYVVAAIATVIAAVVNRGKSRENQLIDQLQEEVTNLRVRFGQMERNELILRLYVFQLQSHIADGKPPPPPPLPPELLIPVTKES